MTSSQDKPRTPTTPEHEECEHANETKNDHSQHSEKNTFTKREKWFIVCLTSFCGFFSPLSSNIYFPVIPLLAETFNKSTELINLTVTMYMVLQGIAPMMWGTLSDNLGRRPASAGCLFLLTLSCVGLALVPTNAYWLLMVLRCVQAAGSASTIAIGAGVISDISTPAERAGFFGFFVVGPMVGPAFGPVIGGALAQSLGWRSIFWFLCIAAFCCFAVIIIVIPETLAAVRHKKEGLWKIVYTPLVPVIGRKNQALNGPPPPKKPFQNPFKLFAQFDINLLFAINALICAVFYGVTASISTLFVRTYPFLDHTKTGLCFLAIGGGMGIGSSMNGKFLDIWYQRTKKKFAEKMSQDAGEKDIIDPQTVDRHPDFPLEKARLQFLPVLVVILAACVAGYGWALERGAHIAVPLVLQVIMGYMSIAVMNGASTIMIDLAPGQGSAIQACNNLVRCSLSALLVSVIELIFKGIGVGWTHILLTGMTLLALPVIFLELKYGPRIRKKRLHSL